MRYYDEAGMQAVRAALEREVLQWPGVTAHRMFGCPCYQARGKLFAFLVTGQLVLTRLPADLRGRIGKKFDAAPFQAGKKRVAAWLQIRCESAGALAELRRFVRLSFNAARVNAGPRRG